MVSGVGAEVAVDTRNRPRHNHQADQRHRCGQGDQSENREDANLRRTSDAILDSRCSRKMHLTAARSTNAYLADYKIPGIRELPDKTMEKI